jgi:maltooligosyltrehalose trehalohydrolase
VRHIVRTMTSGFGYQGEASRHRGGKPRGEPSGELPPAAFVNFLQNHDQIGNRPFGDRLTTQATPAALQAATAILLLAPMPPLMFMGEEWGTTRPFPFFCDFHGELAEAVRRGRRAEFKSAYESAGGEIPDALCETTFLSAKLDWEALAAPPAQARLDLVRRLLAIRAAEIAPHLAGARFRKPTVESAGPAIMLGWRLGNGSGLHLLANVAAKQIPKPVAARGGRPIWRGAPPDILPPWSVFWSVGAD